MTKVELSLRAMTHQPGLFLVVFNVVIGMGFIVLLFVPSSARDIDIKVGFDAT
jgi:hypothetical protein